MSKVKYIKLFSGDREVAYEGYAPVSTTDRRRKVTFPECTGGKVTVDSVQVFNDKGKLLQRLIVTPVTVTAGIQVII